MTCTFNPWLGPGVRLLGHYLARLRHTLNDLAARLRAAVAVAVGETVAGIVREAVQAVLDELPALPDTSKSLVRPPASSHPLWGEPEEPAGEPWPEDADDWPPHPTWAREIPCPPTHVESWPSRWPGATALGVRVALCWLGRRAGRFPVLSAVGAGLLTAVAAYVGGPLAAAGVGLAGSALGLMSLADAVRTGADALAVFSSS